MQTLSFEAKLNKKGAFTMLVLPKNISAKLPSRGIVAVQGQINHHDFNAVLEPNGESSHWVKLKEPFLKEIKSEAGNIVNVTITPSIQWPEPKLSTDLKKVLDLDPKAFSIWQSITPMARWDWIRWIYSAKQIQTQEKRLQSIGSRLKSGKRRPCCFNRAECTITEA